MHVCAHMHTHTRHKCGDQKKTCKFSPSSAGSGDQTQVPRLGGEASLPTEPSHHESQSFFFKVLSRCLKGLESGFWNCDCFYLTEPASTKSEAPLLPMVKF